MASQGPEDYLSLLSLKGLSSWRPALWQASFRKTAATKVWGVFMPNNAIRVHRVATVLLAAGFFAPLWANQSGPMPAAAPSSSPAAQSAAPDSPKQPTSANPAPMNVSDSTTSQHSAAKVIEVVAGTHIPLVLHNAISTKSARKGDPVYFETLFPVMVNGHVAIP